MTYNLCLDQSPNVTEINHPFLAELIKQFRLQDSSGDYQNWSDEKVLKSLLFSADSHRHCATKRGAVDPLTHLRVSAYYYAVGVQIEKETGQLAEIFINLSNQGLSSALVCCGHLLVISEMLQKVACFGFESLETLLNEADHLIYRAVTRVRQFV